MSAVEEETLHVVRKMLAPYVKSREEVAHIRRVLALHLDSCLKDGSATGPLALVESSDPRPSPAARGLQKEYLEALAANIKAHNHHKALCRDFGRDAPAVQETEPTHDRLRDHLATISLQRKQERLQAVEQRLEQLRSKPAASQDFLDPREMFRNSRPLLDVPKEVVNSLTLDIANANTQLKDLIDQLEKHVLRTKLLLKREEQLLDQVKSRSTATPETISESAKFEALNATRTELINWIEAELAKASGDGSGPEEQDAKQQAPHDGDRIDERLASIKKKYSRYLEARKALLMLVSQQPRPIMKPQAQDNQPQADNPQQPSLPPSVGLLSPYLQQLLFLSHKQKGLISQKAHLNTIIAKQLKETGQTLDYLAEESQMIPSHPMPGMARRKQPGAFGDAISSPSDNLDSSSHVKPWVFAADSAKIATLEAIAEKIDEGQMALEGSMKTIGEIEQLLGQQHPVGQDEQQCRPEGDGTAAEDDDIWLAESKPPIKSAGEGTRPHIDRRGSKPRSTTPGDVWDLLDGKLGLLRSESEPT
ncbi:hypothetical protein B0H66DRAFT_59996 [Apodospora peruviana]|uniref:Uncharacterized protein n=1 Tax=Apodospora peruviana TaxID=516989 RepID=A0AAE0ISR6_9PEZI|nr:hypothetical protein B0H66DRAFT_59996 [Apodospora peruviana]